MSCQSRAEGRPQCALDRRQPCYEAMQHVVKPPSPRSNIYTYGARVDGCTQELWLLGTGGWAVLSVPQKWRGQDLEGPGRSAARGPDYVDFRYFIMMFHIVYCLRV